MAYALELSEESKIRAAHAKRMADSAKSMTAKSAALMDYAQIAIQNIAYPMPMRLPEFTINLAKMPPKSDVFDEALVPDGYKTRILTFTLKHDAVLDAVNVAAQWLAELSQDTSFDSTVRRADILSDLKIGVLIPGARAEPLAYRLTVK